MRSQALRSLFSKSGTASKQAGPEVSVAVNPVLAARKEWDDRYGDLATERYAWRAICVLLAIINAFALCAIFSIASQRRLIPYVIEVDQLRHEVHAVGPADMAQAADPRVIRSLLMRFIEDVRTVTPDAAVKYKQISEGFSMVASGAPASGMLRDYYSSENEKNDPFKRAANETVAIEINTAIPESPNTWRLDWQEIVTARTGAQISNTAWTANITVQISPPKDENTMAQNPIGLYVVSYHWAPRGS